MKHVFIVYVYYHNIIAQSVFITSSSIGNLGAEDIEILLVAATSFMIVIMLTTLTALTTLPVLTALTVLTMLTVLTALTVLTVLTMLTVSTTITILQ